MPERKIIAQRGTTLRCQGWRQEAILRLLENNLENAENPAELVIYMSVAKAARDWAAYDRIVAALERLEAGETLVMQSGKPIGIFPTRADGPLVVMASGNLVPAWSSDDHVNDFVRKGLTIVPVGTVDELLKHALVSPPVPIEWVDEDAKVLPAAKVEEERPGVITH